MCMGNEQAARREKRIRAFLATLEEIAADAARVAARDEIAKDKADRPEPGPECDVKPEDEPAKQDCERDYGWRPTVVSTEELVAMRSNGKLLSHGDMEMLRGLRKMLKARRLDVFGAILDEAMGW